MEVVVISGDRDLLQLATKKVKIRIPKTKQGRTEVEDYLEDKFDWDRDYDDWGDDDDWGHDDWDDDWDDDWEWHDDQNGGSYVNYPAAGGDNRYDDDWDDRYNDHDDRYDDDWDDRHDDDDDWDDRHDDDDDDRDWDD